MDGVLILTLLLASLPSTSPCLTLFAAEEHPLRPVGLPLSARPSRPCSTRLQWAEFWGVLVHPQCKRALVWAPLLHPPHAGTRLPVGNTYPFLPSLVDMTVRGWVGSQTTGMGALHFGMRRNLWLAVGTASLGPSGKKDPGWCMGTLPGASLQTVSLCSFLGYSNCPTFPKGSSGVSQAQQAQCWPPAWLKLYIYLLWPY